MKCKDCKYWDKDSYCVSHCNTNAKKFGLCIKFSDNDEDFEMAKKYGDDRLADAICYSEGISGQFITKPEFGCIEFELIE